jgi:deazaflavin-dependent oxidoreductase (nitroreductase family)
MTYPAGGTLNRLIFKTPLILWRMGLGPVLGRGMMVLTTWGRVSHLPRWTMLSCTRHAGPVYALAGWGERSDWYQNILRNPHVTLQPGGRPHGALARRVTRVEEFGPVIRRLFEMGGDAYFRPWLASLEIDCEADDVIEKRERVHMIAFDPVDHPGPPPMPVDLGWVWPVLLAALALAGLFGQTRRRGRPNVRTP